MSAIKPVDPIKRQIVKELYTRALKRFPTRHYIQRGKKLK